MPSIDGASYGVPVQAVLKGIVWYPLQAFTEAGYTRPRRGTGSWRSAGRWSPTDAPRGASARVEKPRATTFGWPATDWIEALVLRLGGVDLYDRWTAGEVGFDHPVVREAFTRFGEVAFGEGSVLAGGRGDGGIRFTSPQSTRCRPTRRAAGRLTAAACGMGAGMLRRRPRVLRSAAHHGGSGGPTGRSGPPSSCRPTHDRPEVREFVTSLFDRNWGVRWADVAATSYLSPSLGFGVHHCRSDELYDLLRVAANEVRVSLCEVQRDTLNAGLQRFDASEHMPVAIGGQESSDGIEPGAFLQGMLD